MIDKIMNSVFVRRKIMKVRRIFYKRRTKQLTTPKGVSTGGDGLDLFVAGLFGDKAKEGGVFVDIGAFDGMQSSNSLYFEQKFG